MEIRRVVTGIDTDGKSAVVEDGPPPRTGEVHTIPGFSASLIWASSAEPKVGAMRASDPTHAVTSFVPEVSATRLMYVTFPPDSVMMAPGFDPAAAGEELAKVLPGLAETFELEHPGMHTTNSVDYDVVLDGEIWLELDDGLEVKLVRNEVVVQQGTRHAWRNKGTAPATMLFVLVGAHRER
jgi:hypothetical protein